MNSGRMPMIDVGELTRTSVIPTERGVNTAPSPAAPPCATARARLSSSLARCLALILTASTVHAQDKGATAMSGASETSELTAVSAVDASPFKLQLNLDYATAYFYRGIIQEDTGFILQPSAKMTARLHEHGDFKVEAFLAAWNSFHGQKTAEHTDSDFLEYWYEFDIIGGATFTKGAFSLTAQYAFLTSPSDAFETVQELNFILAYDDADLLGDFSLHPYVLLAIETGADASDGGDSDPGTYLELGIAPGFSFDAGRTPVSITFPTSIGLSLHNYYQNAARDDDTFGFIQIGAKASFPLPIGDRYGSWSINAGASAMFLGDHTTDFNDGQREQFIATVGLQIDF